jgi:hypothetical protein
MVRGQRRLKTTSRAPRRSRRLKALEEKPPGCEPGGPGFLEMRMVTQRIGRAEAAARVSLQRMRRPIR